MSDRDKLLSFFLGQRNLLTRFLTRRVGNPETAEDLAQETWLRLAVNGLTLGAGIRYIGSTEGDQANTFEVPSYTLVDASLHYDLTPLDNSLKGMALAVDATNLADKTYVAACDATTICYYGIGRTIMARFKYEW